MTNFRKNMSEHTVPYLAALLRCSKEEAVRKPMTWQAFPDNKGDRGKCTRIIHGAFNDVFMELSALNDAGAGIFVTVNETDLQGRKKENIKVLRALWADLDDKDADAPLENHELRLKPTLCISSGHGTHLYWVLSSPLDANPENKALQESLLKSIQQVLAPFGADAKVCEVARVMRVPGFYNKKAEPFQRVSLLKADGPVYCVEDIHRVFAPAPLRRGGPDADTRHSRQSGGCQYQASPGKRSNKVNLASEHLKSCLPAIAGERGHDMLFKAAMQAGPGFGLDEDTTFKLLRDVYNPMCKPVWTEVELRHKVTDVFKKESRRGWMLHPRGKAAPDLTGTITMCAADQGQLQPREGDQDDDPNRPCFGNYISNATGLFKRILVSDREELIPISDPFQVLAEVRSPTNTEWGLRVAWRDRDDVHHERTILREAIIGEGQDVIKLFVSEGLAIHHRKTFLDYLTRVVTPNRGRSIEHIGWQESMFVLPDETFGTSEEPVFLDLEQGHHFRVAGSLKEWKWKVGKYGGGNSRLAFAISVGFSAALLSPLGVEPGGFNIFGPSSKGKTTCAEVAGSVWGGPRYSETWRATSNGLESIALAHNDALLVLDEQGQADPRECGEIAYMLSNGIDKVRATKTLGNRARRRWRVTTLSTGEVTLADKMREIHMNSKAGQAVRLVDIPICPVGLDQGFEDNHHLESSQALANHLKIATQKYYGTPIREFLRRWQKLPPEAITELKARMQQWTVENVPKGSDSQVARVADRFALTAAAGELAVAWQILPWAPREADFAAVTCFRAWLSHRGGIRSGERQEGIRAVLDFIDRHGQSRFKILGHHDQKVMEMVGWRDEAKKEECAKEPVRYLFSPTGWREACDGFDPRVVAQAMLEEGLLEVGNATRGSKTQKKVRVDGESRWVYAVSASAILEYRERETQGVGVFPPDLGVNQTSMESMDVNTRTFFEKPWMFPRSSVPSKQTNDEVTLFILGACEVDPEEEVKMVRHLSPPER